ncbi:alpha/beta hydrolase [Aliiroseovarius sp. YM-037]|uniref:alpha/beta hydrolase n=1 Tax=Aliiroseovarius sp. YM-037 TaxID=3341728 RepID=UPI003A80F53F
MEDAPLFTDIADAPDGGKAWWLTTADGVRIRIGVWAKGSKGTVLLFPGRTEYIEKYGRAARDLADRGYAMVAIDWRGQGLADRLIKDPAPGHVTDFAEYQHDVDAALQAVDQLDLPGPRFLIGHSMGGCIGLRALHRGLDVRASVFTAPMWGIQMSNVQRPAAWVFSWLSRFIGMGHRLTPGSVADSYVSVAPFEDNMLTTDADMYAYMQRQLAAHPELALGGPSLRWLFAALSEIRKLHALPPPKQPGLTFLGSQERIVVSDAVERYMHCWPNGTLRKVQGAEHEVLMETPAIRKMIFNEADALFSEHDAASRPAEKQPAE